ncbi:MAG: type II toxin-antitoxin system PemK/MazF family toxin, partial [Actinomycetes bacterium]
MGAGAERTGRIGQPDSGVTGDLRQGTVVWVDLAPVKGREQGGHRPAVVISSPDHLSVIT